jgi:murein tripeptide amidase MpaA
MNNLLVIFAIIGAAAASTLTFNEFWPLNEVEIYLDELARDYSDIASVTRSTQTTREGRQIRIFNINRGGTSKPTIFIESGLRPREWLSPMTSLYIIHEIVEHYYDFEDLLNRVNFIIIPVANPDGYAFSFTAGNRNWNKNRNPVSLTCIGADLGRNFNYQFLGGSDVSFLK